MHRYYKADRTIKVYYDIVGPGYEIENLKKLVNEYRLDEYVKYLLHFLDVLDYSSIS